MSLGLMNRSQEIFSSLRSGASGGSWRELTKTESLEKGPIWRSWFLICVVQGRHAGMSLTQYPKAGYHYQRALRKIRSIETWGVQKTQLVFLSNVKYFDLINF